MADNPYESPRAIEPKPPSGGSSLHGIRKNIAGGGILLGACMGVLGRIITFVPTTGPNWWYLYAAILTSAGLLWPSWWGRGLAIALLIWLGSELNASYWRGKTYEHWLKAHPSARQAP